MLFRDKSEQLSFSAKLYYIQQISGTVLQIIQNNGNQHKQDTTEVFSSLTRWQILSLNIYSWIWAIMVPACT